jgi:hypothetical protein
MTNQLDPRIVKVSIEVNGRINTYDQILIKATGTKYANALQNEAQITITNLDKVTQDYILTETSPFNQNRTPKVLKLYAGRESYGSTLIFSGNIVSATVSQPPDVTISLKCLTGNYVKGTILARNKPGIATLQDIAKGISQDINTILNFQATNKNISNYTFNGSALDQVRLLGSAGSTAFVDDDILVVKDVGVPIRGAVRELSSATGMIGIPEITEQGIRVKYLLDNISRLGGGLDIVSTVYPAVNGSYIIYKLGFEISNRETPFYYIAEAARKP